MDITVIIAQEEDVSNWLRSRQNTVNDAGKQKGSTRSAKPCPVHHSSPV
jgi:hypothetical protein